MLRSYGDRGREAAGDGPEPEGGRDPPKNLEGTSLRWLSFVDLSPTRCECHSAVTSFHAILFDREFYSVFGFVCRHSGPIHCRLQ